MASFRDVGYILPIAIQMMLYLSPVAYDIAAVPSRYRTLYGINPLSAPIEGLRESILGVGHVQFTSVVSSIVSAIALLLLGAIYFRRHEQRFADVI
jgi:lipopolysaccharide transport system permease protein